MKSEIRTLERYLAFHDGIRRWFELKLDQPECGESSIELMQNEQSGTPIERFRGCRVRSRGAIDLSLTGYYSLGIFQEVQAIQSVGACETKSPFPDYSKVKRDKAIRAYRVDMLVNYKPGDHPVVFHVTNGMKLQPRQAYASSG